MSSKRGILEVLKGAVEKFSGILSRNVKLDYNLATVYLRVSRADEDISNQLHTILEYSNSKGYQIVHLEKDIDISGTTPPWERENFVNLVKKSTELGAGTILFYDLSRMARSVEWGLITLYILLDYGFNVEFVAMKFLDYITDKEMKKKVILDFLWFAEMYVEDIRRRTKAALERLRAEGKLYHRPRVELPCDDIKRLLNAGLPMSAIYKFLVSQGKLKYRAKNEERVLSYNWFLKRVKRDCKI